MKLTKRKGIYQASFTIEGKRKRVSTGESDYEAAMEKTQRLVATARRVAGLDWTLGDALQDCYTRIWYKSKSYTHVAKRIGKLRREHSGHTGMMLKDVSYDSLIVLTMALEQGGAKDATINRYLALVSKALAEAVKRKRLAIKPPLPYRAESAGKLRWITPEEERSLYEGAEALWPRPDAVAMCALIAVLLDTGCRLSEVLGAARLPVSQITLTDTKNGQSRSVPLTDRARLALTKVPLWTPMQAIGRFSRLRDACDMPDVTLHTLRHTCASRLVQGGMDLYRVKEWLGHSSITVTQRYAHLSESNLTQGVDILTHHN